MLVENDHFSLKYSNPQQIGMKAIEQNASDIASMGGIPKFALVSLALPNEIDVDFVDKLYSGVNQKSKKYRISIVGGNIMHSKDIVVADHEIATGCIKHLKAKKIGRARFLPLDRIRGREKKEYKGKEHIIGYAIDLVRYDRKFSPAIEFVIGSTLVVKNIDIAKKIKGFRIVTLDGDLVEPSGAMIGGFYRKQHRESYAAKIRHLEGDSERLEDEIRSLDKELGKYNLQDKGETANVREDKIKIEKMRELKLPEEEITGLKTGE